MSAESIIKLVEKLSQISAPKVADFAELLGVEPERSRENPSWNMYQAKLAETGLERADLRLAKSDGRAHLSLWPQDSAQISEQDLGLSRWGQPVSIDINPRIPPEGTVAFVYDLNHTRVAVQMTHTSRQLRSIALEWT